MQPLHIGIRAHDFGKLPADELAARIAAKGLSCVQLALNKAIAGLDLVPGRGDLTPGLAWQIGQSFARHNLQIAVLGCYINLSHPDPAARAPLIAYFKEHLRIARDFGTASGGIVATETGSLNPDWSPHRENGSSAAYDALVPTIADLVETAEHFGTTVGIEGVAHHVLDSPRCIRKLIRDIRSPNLQIVFDPVNLLDGTNYQEQDRIMQESFDLFGDRIAIIHAKDFHPIPPAAAAPNMAPPPVRQLRTGGTAEFPGHLHYPLLMQWIIRNKPGIAILLEESDEASVDASTRYIQNHAR